MYENPLKIGGFSIYGGENLDKVVLSTMASMFKGGHKILCYISIIVCTMICEDRLSLFTEPPKGAKNMNGNILSEMIQGASMNYRSLMICFMGIGFVIACVGLAASFILLMNSGVIEVKDSFYTMVIRFVIAIFAIFLINSFTLKCLSLGTDVETSISKTVSITDKNGKGIYGGDALLGAGLFYNMLTNGEDKDGNASLNWFDDWGSSSKSSSLFGSNSLIMKLASSTTDLVYTLLAAFINFVIALLITYNIIKLAVELIRRYTMTQILQMVSSIFAGFIASASSMTVFLSYMKMFVTEIGIYLLTKIWLVLSIILLSSSAASKSLTGIIMIYAFLNAGVKMEGIARDLGLTTSSQGAALLDSMVMQGTMIGMAFGGVKNGIGRGIFNAGALSGNAKMAAVGGALSGRRMDFTPAGLQKEMQGTSMGALRRNATAKNAKSNLTKSAKAAAFDSLRQGGLIGKNGFSQIASNLNNAGRKELLGSLAKDYYKMPSVMENGSGDFGGVENPGMALAEAYGDRLRVTGFNNGCATGVLSDSNGIDVATFSIGETRPQNGAFQEIADAAGDPKYMSFTPLRSQSELASHGIDNASAPDLLAKGRPLTNAEAATGCMLNSSNMLFHNDNGTVDVCGENYTTRALGDGAYGIVHSDLNGNSQIASIDFGGGKIAEHGYGWNNLNNVETKSDISDYFGRNMATLDKSAIGITSVNPSGNDRFTVTYNALRDGESVLMKKDFARVTAATTSRVGNSDTIHQIKMQRFYGNSETGHWIGSKAVPVKSKENKKK